MSCPPPAESPRSYLLSWAEILPALGLKNCATRQRQVRRLSAAHDGPLLFPSGKGGQPKADRAKLLAWWNGLEATWVELQARRRDAQLSAGQQHPYGRAGTVAPEIAGAVKPRRVS